MLLSSGFILWMRNCVIRLSRYQKEKKSEAAVKHYGSLRLPLLPCDSAGSVGLCLLMVFKL